MFYGFFAMLFQMLEIQGIVFNCGFTNTLLFRIKNCTEFNMEKLFQFNTSLKYYIFKFFYLIGYRPRYFALFLSEVAYRVFKKKERPVLTYYDF